MSDSSLIFGDNSDSEAADQLVQRQWDRFVAGDTVSLATTSLPSHIVLSALAEGAHEPLSAMDTTKADSVDLGRFDSRDHPVAPIALGPASDSHSNHDAQVADGSAVPEQRS